MSSDAPELTMVHGPHRGPMDADALAAAYPWPADRPWVRAMMVTTLDGAAAGPDGLSGTISSTADKGVFNAVRRFADAVLVGAGTFRDEEYGAMKARGEVTRGQREAAGQAPAPVLAIVSGSLDLPWEGAAFTESTLTPIVLTHEGADPDRLAAAREHCEVVVAGSAGPAELVAALLDRGLRRIVCEGGPSLLAGLAAAGVLDEADITLSPMFTGTEHTPHTSGFDAPTRLHLAHVIVGDGFLMNRYVADADA